MLKQITVYAENKKGTMKDITGILASHDINIWGSVTNESSEFGMVRMIVSDPDKALKELRSFMFTNVYRNPVAKGEESKAKDMLKRLFEYYIAHPEALPEDFQPQLSFDGMERTVCDYIAGMTDNYAVEKFREIFIPMGWQVHG